MEPLSYSSLKPIPIPQFTKHYFETVGRQRMEGYRIIEWSLSERPVKVNQALTLIQTPFSGAGSRFCSAALREAYLACGEA